MIQKLQQLAADKRAALRESEGGFTLIELLVVVVIIGILIAIAIPLYLNYQKGAHDKSAQSDLRGAVSALQQCYTENSNVYPAGTATNVAGTAATWTCGTTTETANLSDGTTLVYNAFAADHATACTAAAGDCATFEIKAYNTGGNKNTAAQAYDYKSWLGGQIQ